MSSNLHDFIPRPDAAFDDFFRNIVDYVLDNRVRWGHIEQADAYALEGQFADWTAAYNATREPHIPQVTAEKNRVRVITERALRAFINRFLRWPPVTDFDRDKMGIRNWDTTPTQQPRPTTQPEIEADTSITGQLSFRVRDRGAVGWARPEHVHGIEFAWGIMEARPFAAGEMPHLETVSSNPILLEFLDGERGLRVFYAARWLNNKMEHGPWCDIESSVIP
jgi:hypothetical protein